MAGRQNSHAESPIARQAHRGHHVGRAGGHYHERRVLVSVQVERLPPLVVTLFARRVGGAPQTGPKLFEHRAVDDRLHITSRSVPGQDHPDAPSREEPYSRRRASKARPSTSHNGRKLTRQEHPAHPPDWVFLRARRISQVLFC
jgi:hypothetical protein